MVVESLVFGLLNSLPSDTRHGLSRNLKSEFMKHSENQY
ncbi:hypothetical protein ECC18A13_008830 [Enterobacter sp. 18A13]|nr:hypothetical protein ECC18A13_008830 [Enterobacter sp. 18A13]BEK78360.1 hypothetical protein EATA8330_12540 [Enterobacter asburiae]